MHLSSRHHEASLVRACWAAGSSLAEGPFHLAYPAPTAFMRNSCAQPLTSASMRLATSNVSAASSCEASCRSSPMALMRCFQLSKQPNHGVLSFRRQPEQSNHGEQRGHHHEHCDRHDD